MAELRPNHHGYLSDLTLTILELHRWLLITALLAFDRDCLLQFDIDKNLCLISHTSNPGLMWPQRSIRTVLLLIARRLANGNITKCNVIRCFLIIVANVLPLLLNLCRLEFVDHFLDTVLQKSFEWLDLLGDEPVHLKVAVDYLPAVFCVDGLFLIATCHFNN